MFSAWYVFGPEPSAGAEWLEVGADRDGGETAWIRADRTVPWKQTVVLGFDSPADRIPVLFFEDRPRLETFVQDEFDEHAG